LIRNLPRNQPVPNLAQFEDPSVPPRKISLSVKTPKQDKTQQQPIRHHRSDDSLQDKNGRS
ncbi:MAG: hypothetical protein WA299_14040, partial [Candidatus Acidiferrum sp.]